MLLLKNVSISQCRKIPEGIRILLDNHFSHNCKGKSIFVGKKLIVPKWEKEKRLLKIELNIALSR